MEKKNAVSMRQQEGIVPCEAGNAHAENMSPTQIQQLVHLLDRTDISEIEVNRAEEGLHLVLRKFKATEHFVQSNESQQGGIRNYTVSTDKPDSLHNLHSLKAQIVGTFHPWLKPHSKSLIAVGDLVKAGQVVGTIEMLTILNEVKTAVAGCVVEISIQDGQSVEYGQLLMTIDSSGGEKGSSL